MDLTEVHDHSEVRRALRMDIVRPNFRVFSISASRGSLVSGCEFLVALMRAMTPIDRDAQWNFIISVDPRPYSNAIANHLGIEGLLKNRFKSVYIPKVNTVNRSIDGDMLGLGSIKYPEVSGLIYLFQYNLGAIFPSDYRIDKLTWNGKFASAIEDIVDLDVPVFLVPIQFDDVPNFYMLIGREPSVVVLKNLDSLVG